MNKHKILRTVGQLAMSSIDRKAATELASSLVAGVARRQGNPALRTIAGLVAQGLDDSAQRQSVPVSRRQGPPDVAGQSWQRALDLMKTPSSPSASGKQAERAEHAEGQLSPRRSKPDGEILRGLLMGYYDTANVGRYTFSLMNGVQLQVGSPREPGGVGGQFWLEHMPAGTWHRLKDRAGRLLPIWIQWHGKELRVQVGDGPSSAPLLVASDAGR